MWAEFCDIYLEDKIDKRLETDVINKVFEVLSEKYKKEESEEGMKFLEAVEYMKQGRICMDCNGRNYRIENNKLCHQISFNEWIECQNYEVPTASRWYLTD